MLSQAFSQLLPEIVPSMLAVWDGIVYYVYVLRSQEPRSIQDRKLRYVEMIGIGDDYEARTHVISSRPLRGEENH